MKFRFAFLLALLPTIFAGGCAHPASTASTEASALGSAAASGQPIVPPVRIQQTVPSAAPTPPVAAAPATPPAGKPALYVVGDSTANSGAPIQGWGTPIAAYFDPEKITVLNRARGGRSSRSFIHEGLWAAIVANLKPGDFVLLQFGHNDGGTPGQGTRPERPSLRGLGDETVEVTTNGQPETVHTFGYNMRKYISDAKAKGATIVVLTPTNRNNWENGHIERGLGNYGPWSIEVALSQSVPLVDMNSLIADKYDALGQEGVTPYFSADRTHTTPAGADSNAAAIVSGLKTLKGNPLAPYLSAKGQAVPAADSKYISNNTP